MVRHYSLRFSSPASPQKLLNSNLITVFHLQLKVHSSFCLLITSCLGWNCKNSVIIKYMTDHSPWAKCKYSTSPHPFTLSSSHMKC